MQYRNFTKLYEGKSYKNETRTSYLRGRTQVSVAPCNRRGSPKWTEALKPVGMHMRFKTYYRQPEALAECAFDCPPPWSSKQSLRSPLARPTCHCHALHTEKISPAPFPSRLRHLAPTPSGLKLSNSKLRRLTIKIYSY